MPDLRDFEKSAAFGKNADRLREGTKAFLKQLFAEGLCLKEAFRKICEDGDGCSEDEFGTLLYSMCMISPFRANSKYFPPGQERLVNSGKVSKYQLNVLPKKMRDVADTIEALNATILAPANHIRFMPHDAQRQPAREYLIRLYETLPGFLRGYSWHVELFTKYAHGTVKRLTLGHEMAVRLVRYVEDRTGSPHYDEVSHLLEHGWLIAGKTESAPSFLSVAGLTKLYQRWGEAVCGPKNFKKAVTKSGRTNLNHQH